MSAAEPHVAVAVTRDTRPDKFMTLRHWRGEHATHGRGCGTWRDTDIHVYRIWRCSCGAAYKFSEVEEASNPAYFAPA